MSSLSKFASAIQREQERKRADHAEQELERLREVLRSQGINVDGAIVEMGAENAAEGSVAIARY